MLRIVYNVNFFFGWAVIICFHFNTFPYCFHFSTPLSLCYSSYVWSLNNLHYNFALSPVVNFCYLFGIILAVEV